MQVDTADLTGLVAKLADLEVRLGKVTRLHEIVLGEPEPVAVAPRDRHGLVLIRTAPEDSPAGRAPAPGARTPAGVTPNGQRPAEGR